MFAENSMNMRYFYTICLLICLSSLTACEKALLEEGTETVDDKKTTDGSSGSGQNGGSESGGSSSEEQGKGSDSKEDTGSGSGSSSDTDSGSESGSNTGSTEENDSIGYPDSGTSGALETDIVDGNEKKEEIPSSSGLTVQGSTAYSVTEFLTTKFSKQIWVVGYIVGDCTKKIANADFEPPFSQPQAILLADSPNETSIDKVITIKLPQGTKRDTYNLQDHPENKGRRAAFFGFQETYLGVPGIKTIDAHQWMDE